MVSVRVYTTSRSILYLIGFILALVLDDAQRAYSYLRDPPSGSSRSSASSSATGNPLQGSYSDEFLLYVHNGKVLGRADPDMYSMLEDAFCSNTYGLEAHLTALSTSADCYNDTMGVMRYTNYADSALSVDALLQSAGKAMVSSILSANEARMLLTTALALRCVLDPPAALSGEWIKAIGRLLFVFPNPAIHLLTITLVVRRGNPF